jgi:hypothetical protein
MMTASLFTFDNYKDFLKNILHADNSPRGVQSQMAKHLNCQSSYIYQVLKNKNELTEDQAFLTTTFFNFNELETYYFLLLVRHSKTLNVEMKKYLDSEIEKIKNQAQKLINSADAKEPENSDKQWQFYFSNPVYSFIHLLTNSRKYQTLEALSLKLNLDTKTLALYLNELKKNGFLTFNNNCWKSETPSTHFSSQSEHNLNLHILRRSQAVSSILNSRNENSLHFSTLFSLDKKTYNELRWQISDFIKKTQKKIHSAPSEEIYVICMDLFSPL